MGAMAEIPTTHPLRAAWEQLPAEGLHTRAERRLARCASAGALGWKAAANGRRSDPVQFWTAGITTGGQYRRYLDQFDVAPHDAL